MFFVNFVLNQFGSLLLVALSGAVAAAASES